jgi:hypothetical protein
MQYDGAPEAVVSDLFLTILSRRPTEKELRQARSYVERASPTSRGLRDLAWVLIMTSEFSLNH